MNTARTIQQNTEKSQDCLINDNLDFYKWFKNIAPKLAHREISFKKIFKYLDGLPTPIIILETGCLRKRVIVVRSIMITSLTYSVADRRRF